MSDIRKRTIQGLRNLLVSSDNQKFTGPLGRGEAAKSANFMRWSHEIDGLLLPLHAHFAKPFSKTQAHKDVTKCDVDLRGVRKCGSENFLTRAPQGNDCFLTKLNACHTFTNLTCDCSCCSKVAVLPSRPAHFFLMRMIVNPTTRSIEHWLF